MALTELKCCFTCVGKIHFHITFTKIVDTELLRTASDDHMFCIAVGDTEPYDKCARIRIDSHVGDLRAGV